ESSVDIRKVGGGGACAAGVDVLDQERPDGGAIALEEFRTVAAVVGDKEQCATDVCQLAGIGAGGAGPDVFDEDGSRGRSVAPPHLLAAVAVRGREEKRAV